MKTYSISQLARSFGMSRSTLLYYDRIGLLRAPERTAAGYRLYTQNEFSKLQRICMFRSAGLPLADVQKLLSSSAAPSAKILESRLQDLEHQILSLRVQQHSIIAMLKKMKRGTFKTAVDKTMWVTMMEAAGMDESSMAKWHAEFESRAPKAHKDFLLSLGISEHEARKIQEWSRRKK
jgi:MerR family transcriptional regulator, thiopeptide resistance regulator